MTEPRTPTGRDFYFGNAVRGSEAQLLRTILAIEAEATLPVPALDPREAIQKLLPDTEYQIETMDGHLRPMQTPADGWEACQSQVLALLAALAKQEADHE